MSKEATGKYARTLNLLINLALFGAALVFAGLIFQKYFRPPAQAYAGAPPVERGAKLPGLELKPGENEQLLVLVLSTECHFCTDSAPLYRRVAAAAAGKPIRLVALLPQPEDEGREYLKRLQLSVEDVRRVYPPDIGIYTTPTLLLLDKDGAVNDMWIGQLSTNMEFALLDRLNPKGRSADGGGGDYPQTLPSELRADAPRKVSHTIYRRG